MTLWLVLIAWLALGFLVGTLVGKIIENGHGPDDD